MQSHLFFLILFCSVLPFDHDIKYTDFFNTPILYDLVLQDMGFQKRHKSVYVNQSLVLHIHSKDFIVFPLISFYHDMKCTDLFHTWILYHLIPNDMGFLSMHLLMCLNECLVLHIHLKFSVWVSLMLYSKHFIRKHIILY